MVALMLGVYRLCGRRLGRDNLLLVHDVGVLASHRPVAHVLVVGRVLYVGLAGDGHGPPAQHL